MSVDGHFERVATVYESLRTTDEAPVHAIGQFLPGRPVTGLDIGCGTGRYTRLLRGLLPHGSLLAGCDLSQCLDRREVTTGRAHARSSYRTLPFRIGAARGIRVGEVLRTKVGGFG